MGWCLLLLLVTVVWGQETGRGVVEHNHVHPADELAGTEVVMACVVLFCIFLWDLQDMEGSCQVFLVAMAKLFT